MPAATAQQSLGLIRRSPLEREFERLYHRYVADVYRYALYVLRDGPEAEDVTQAAFLNAFRAFQRGERPHKPRSWLLTIVHNECRRYFRSKSRRPAEVELDEGLTADLPPAGDVPTPEEIRRALGELSFNQRAALVMRELEGRSYAEIAETLDVSVSAVETLLFRARRALREQLEGALTCGEVELALSKQLDNRLSADERASLRAHLRSCKECARLARRQRAQRTALRGLGPVPLPGSLSTLFGGGGGTAGGLLAGGSALGGGLALKAAAILVGGAVATGAGMGAALAGSGGAAPRISVAPVRLAPPATGGSSAVAVAVAAAPVRRGAGETEPAASRRGAVGGRLLNDDVEDVDARRPSRDAERRRRGADAGPNESGSGGEDGTRPEVLPPPAPVELPRVPVATPQVTVPTPAVEVPKAPVSIPSVAPPEPAVPQVTVPAIPAPPPLPPVEVPTLPAAPPLPPPPLPLP